MKNEQDPRSPTSGLNSSGAQGTPKVSLRDRLNRHDAYWASEAHYRRLVDECDRVNVDRKKAKRAAVEPDRVLAVLRVMAQWAYNDPLLIVNSTTDQLASRTRQSADWVKAALRVATDLGLIQTITKALKPTNGRAGSAPRRAMLYLDVDGVLAGHLAHAELVRASTERSQHAGSNDAAYRTDSGTELVRTSVGIDAACRPPLTNNSLHASLGATEPAIAEAGDGAHYSNDDVTELARRLTAEVARERGAPTAQVRQQDATKIRAAAQYAHTECPDLPADDHGLMVLALTAFHSGRITPTIEEELFL